MRFELVLLFIIVFGWWIFSCCYISYIELMLYDVKVHLYKDNPCWVCLFHPYNTILKTICGILYLVNIYIIMLEKKILPYWGKIVYIVTFLFFFIKQAFHRKLSLRSGYPKDNPILNMIQCIYDNNK